MTREPRRLMDWRFLLVLTVMLAFVWLIVAGIQVQANFNIAQQQSKAKTVRISTLIADLQDQSDRNASNTAAFENNQRVLLAYVEALNARQMALLHYLSKHGVKVPQKFLTPVTVPSLTVTSSSGGTISTPKTVSKPKKHGKTKKAVPPKSHKGGKRR